MTDSDAGTDLQRLLPQVLKNKVAPSQQRVCRFTLRTTCSSCLTSVLPYRNSQLTKPTTIGWGPGNATVSHEELSIGFKLAQQGPAQQHHV